MSQSQAELDRLEAFLDSEQVPEGTMNISTLDGFLTAVAVGPEPIPTEEWVPMIWPDPGPRFADAQAEEIGSLIAARLEQIQRELGGEPPQCSPVYWLTDNDEEIAFDWAEGFMVGVYLRTEAWMPLIGDELNAEMLMPVLILCEDEDGRPLIELDAEEEGELVEAAPAVIPEMVVEIAQFWKERGPPLQPVRRDGAKIGRNDTCPCGSGKKYKRCCGVN